MRATNLFAGEQASQGDVEGAELASNPSPDFIMATTRSQAANKRPRQATAAVAAAASPEASSEWAGEAMPDELLVLMFGFVGDLAPETLFLAVPAVCRRWAAVCKMMVSVDLDLGFACLPKECPVASLLSALANRFLDSQLTALTVTSGSDYAAIMAVCPKLSKLNVRGYASDDDATGVATNFPQLEELVMEFCRATDAGLEAIAGSCHRLKQLTFTTEECEYPTDDGLMSLAKGCPDLEDIMLCTCVDVSDKGVAALIEGCTKLVPDDIVDLNWYRWVPAYLHDPPYARPTHFQPDPFLA